MVVLIICLCINYCMDPVLPTHFWKVFPTFQTLSSVNSFLSRTIYNSKLLLFLCHFCRCRDCCYPITTAKSALLADK